MADNWFMMTRQKNILFIVYPYILENTGFSLEFDIQNINRTNGVRSRKCDDFSI